jgi:hypothetical protein
MRALQKNTADISEGTNAQYKGIAPRITKTSNVTNQRRLGEIMFNWTEEEESDGHEDF